MVTDVQRPDLAFSLATGPRLSRTGDIELRAVDVIEEPDALPRRCLFRRKAALGDVVLTVVIDSMLLAPAIRPTPRAGSG